MKTRAAVLAGKNNIYIREFELPEINEDELLVKIVSNSICLSTYKALIRGEEHKRVPENVSKHPAITGHEFAGIIEKVGSNLKDKFKEGQRFVLQPAMGLESGYSAGYSYEYFGGNATYCIIPKIAIDLGCVLPLNGTYFANASLSEPMSCIIGAFHASYHTKPYVYKHDMGIKEGGKLALLGCAGPMGLGAIEYAINGPVKPKLVVVVDIDEERLNRAASLITVEGAKEKGVELIYLNNKDIDAVSELRKLSGGKGYDDVFVFAPVKQLIEVADDILGNDGCLNFFAGPTDNNFKVPFNFYNVHYEGTHIVGTSGGSTGDMLESIELSEEGLINPSFMVTHIGGLNAVPETIRNLPNIPGGKKLIYPHIEMELTAIKDFEKLGENDELFRELAKICKKNNNVWCEEAEKFLLEFFENK
ncbi:zinc-binding dehydrogenase [Thermohalobacter berrensis]|uniref:L-sorbose 1-phosphate reductase n=1 Tax=Thermohalobacter berrensis TaxID=99594 RepID=A0A419T780_9FIRM|nr:zinc-binding dehydrogenase [Thermohalobacter berrensis]RKD33420.1 L-sorbose 1-phosphate reductase [Thermohalobacter berrensis]